MSTLWWHRALDPVGKIGNSEFSSLPLTRASLRLNGAKGESHLWFSVSFFLVIYRQDVQTDGLCHNSGCWVRWQCLHPCHTAKAFSKARVFWHTIYLQRWIWKKLVMSQTLTLNMKPDGQSWCLALKFTCAVAIAGSESTVFLVRLRFSIHRWPSRLPLIRWLLHFEPHIGIVWELEGPLAVDQLLAQSKADTIF